MKRGKIIVAGAALAAFIWPGVAQAKLVVRTDRPDVTFNYWIARNEDLRREMAAPGASLPRVLERYGRRPINALAIQTKANVRYTVFPECDGLPKLPGVLADGGQSSVTVNC